MMSTSRNRLRLTALQAGAAFLVAGLCACGGPPESSPAGTSPDAGPPPPNASESFTLCITNTLDQDVRVAVYQTSNYDWDERRPDGNFQNAVIGAHTMVCQGEDVNSYSSSAPATFRFEALGNGWDRPVAGSGVARINDLRVSMGTLHPSLIPTTSSGSTPIQVIFHAWYGFGHITLAHGGINLSRWMQGLPDHRLLSEINSPGTHDSGTDRESGCGARTLWVKAQNKAIDQQLAAGARMLDVRVTENMNVCHGNYVVDPITPLTMVLDRVKSFLAANPSETVLMKVECDADSCKSDAARLARLRATFSSYSSLLAPVQYSVPTLGAVRGKLVLLLARNMQEYPPLGTPLDWSSDVNWEVRSWYDGWSSPRWAVGDNYQPSSVEMKKGNIDFFLGRVWGQQDSDLIPILFISSVIKPLTASPRTMAQAINPWFIERLGRLSASEFRKRIGFVLMDYLGTSPELCGSYEANGLPYLIVASNFRQY